MPGELRDDKAAIDCVHRGEKSVPPPSQPTTVGSQPITICSLSTTVGSQPTTVGSQPITSATYTRALAIHLYKD